MRIPIINSKRQYESIAAKAEAAVLEVMRSGSYILGENNKMLEQVYINESKKNPKSHVDNVYIKCCINELKKRGKM